MYQRNSHTNTVFTVFMKKKKTCNTTHQKNVTGSFKSFTKMIRSVQHTNNFHFLRSIKSHRKLFKSSFWLFAKWFQVDTTSGTRERFSCGWINLLNLYGKFDGVQIDIPNLLLVLLSRPAFFSPLRSYGIDILNEDTYC